MLEIDDEIELHIYHFIPHSMIVLEVSCAAVRTNAWIENLKTHI